MNQPSRYARKVISTLALLLVSAYSYAVDCPGGSNYYYSATGSGTITASTTIVVAVASNFKDPAQDLADDFVAANVDYKVNLCHQSSGTIASSITSGNTYNIALFLAANQAFAVAVDTAGYGLDDPFLYANGTPVFLLSPVIYNSGASPAANYFFTGQTDGAIADGLSPKVVLKHYSGSPTADTIAIANVPGAPYGVKGSEILNPMLNGMTSFWNGGAYVYNAGTNTASACSGLISGSQWQCQYDNVDLTLEAINNNSVTGGFVGWSQVCSYPSTQYVKFSTYVLAQYGILVDVPDNGSIDDNQEAAAALLVNFMNIGSGYWNSFLASHCYS